MKYAAELVMHLNFGSKGGATIKKLTDFPGVTVQDDWDKKAKKTTRTVSCNGQEYATLAEAVEAWKALPAKVDR